MVTGFSGQRELLRDGYGCPGRKPFGNRPHLHSCTHGYGSYSTPRDTIEEIPDRFFRSRFLARDFDARGGLYRIN